MGTEISSWQMEVTRLMLTSLARIVRTVCLLDKVGSSATTWMRTSGLEKTHPFQGLCRNLQVPVVEITPGKYFEIVVWQESFGDKVRRTHNEPTRLTADTPIQDMVSWTSDRPPFAPQWSFAALDGSHDTARVVRYLLSTYYEQSRKVRDRGEGYIEMLRILSEYTETQVAPALLTNVLHACQDNGMNYVAVGSTEKNPTEIAKLHTRFRFRTTDKSIIWVAKVAPNPSTKNHNLRS